MLERLFLAVVGVGPILALLTGIAVVGVGVAWVVDMAVGPRRGAPLAGPLARSEVPEPSRAPAVGTGAMAIGLGVLAVKLAPRPDAIVWGVVATVLAVVTVIAWRNPPVTPKW